MDIRAAYEKYADPRAKYVSHDIWPDGLSISYQVDDNPHQSKSYNAVHPVTGEPGTRDYIEAAEAIGKSVLSDVKAA